MGHNEVTHTGNQVFAGKIFFDVKSISWGFSMGAG
jgi:hypothetical protein